MVNYKILSALILSVFAAAIAEASDVYKTYCNARFGYQIDYPANLLVAQGEPTNGDGQRFLSKSGDVEMCVYGGYLAAWTFDEEFKHALDDQDGAKKKATYKARAKNSFVVSGFHGKKIFYRKTFLKNDTLRTFSIEYPSTKKEIYDQVVEKIVASFKWCT